MLARIKALLHRNLHLKSYSRAWFRMYGVLIQEYRHSFTQFFTIRYPLRSSLHLLAVLIGNLLRMFFGRSHKSSYSFAGEDQVIESLLKSKVYEAGYYVDVGCNHPVFLSNTYLFYRRGWRGVCVDANKELIKKYRYLRPRDKAVHALVSDGTREREFTFLTNNVLSTTETVSLEGYKREGQEYYVERMIPKTLTQILDEQKAPRGFDFLSIDAEEHDFNVVRSIDLGKYHPRVIIMELETLDLSKTGDDDVVGYLKGWGYVLAGYVVKNAYFLRRQEGFEPGSTEAVDK